MAHELFDTLSSERMVNQMLFILKADKLKQVLRRTTLIDGSRRENDAEHSWHLALMAIVLQEHAKERFNMERVLKMLILHDMVEIYAGDTFAFDTAANADKKQRERRAADELFGMLPVEQASELRSLWEEFEYGSSADARYAAAMDRLQPFLHNMMTDGHTWKLGMVTQKQVKERIEPAIQELPSLEPFITNAVKIGIENGWIRT